MKKSKDDKKLKRIVFYVLLFIIILIFLLTLLYYFFTSFFSWKEHQSYIKSSSIQEIETWMSPNTILRYFNISEEDLFEDLNVSRTNTNLRTPLEKICKKNKIDCNLLVKKLDSEVKQ